MVDMNIRNKMMEKLIEANDFKSVTLTKDELYQDIDLVEVLTTVDDDNQSMTFSFKKLHQEV